jgi:hypothetical protein
VTPIAFAWPILPGQQEAWRRFCQGLVGRHSREYTESRKRLSITKELIWLAQTPWGDLAILHQEAEYPIDMLVQLGASDLPFDRSLSKQLLELHGLNLTQPRLHPASELVLAWQLPADGVLAAPAN